MKIVETKFSIDGFVLKGTLHLPETPDPALVIGSHGLEGSRNSAKQQLLSTVLPKNNIAFFRFDHRGCGSSQGLFVEDTSLESRTRDFCAAVDHVLEKGVTSDRIALFGSSMGGATCINAWQRLEQTGHSPRGAVLCAAPVVSATIKNIPFEANDNRPALPLSFFEKNLLFDLSDQTAGLHHVMLFHGDADEIVPKKNADKIFAAMQSPKELVIHPGGDHQMTRRNHQKDFEQKMVEWFKSLFNIK